MRVRRQDKTSKKISETKGKREIMDKDIKDFQNSKNK